MKNRSTYFCPDQISMNRRDFLSKTILAAAAAGASSSFPLRSMAMECQLVENPRKMVKVT